MATSPMRYDLNLLPTFLAVMEERSVTRAAFRLGVTQPALSNSLNRLRETLKDPLFIRERHGIKPTRFAEEIAPIILEALTKIDQAIMGRQEFNSVGANRHFKVAMDSYSEFVLMPDIVARLGLLAPGIKLSLAPLANDLADQGVISGITEIALGRLVAPPDGLIFQHIMEDSLACVVGSSHRDIGTTVSRQQFEGLGHLDVRPPGEIHASLSEAFERQGLHRDVVISVTHFLAVPEIIAVTDYCATLPRRICDRLAKDGRLKVIPTPVDLGTISVGIAWHARYHQDPGHRWFRQLLIATAQALPV